MDKTETTELTKTQAAALSLIEAARSMFPDLHLMVVTMDDEAYSVRFNTDCASVASIMVGAACNAIEANINVGAMHVHAIEDTMRAMQGDKKHAH